MSHPSRTPRQKKQPPVAEEREELTALWTAANQLLSAAIDGDGPMIHAMPGDSADGNRRHSDGALLLVETAHTLLKMVQSIVYGDRS